MRENGYEKGTGYTELPVEEAKWASSTMWLPYWQGAHTEMFYGGIWL